MLHDFNAYRIFSLDTLNAVHSQIATILASIAAGAGSSACTIVSMITCLALETCTILCSGGILPSLTFRTSCAIVIVLSSSTVLARTTISGTQLTHITCKARLCTETDTVLSHRT